VDMKLEVLVMRVSDVDRAKRFYQTLGSISALCAVESITIGSPDGSLPAHRRSCGSLSRPLIDTQFLGDTQTGRVQ
jgi:hypothetical protein